MTLDQNNIQDVLGTLPAGPQAYHLLLRIVLSTGPGWLHKSMFSNTNFKKKKKKKRIGTAHLGAQCETA